MKVKLIGAKSILYCHRYGGKIHRYVTAPSHTMAKIGGHMIINNMRCFNFTKMMFSGLVLRVPVHVNLFLKQVSEQSSSES
jgi:hypothetical protein